jgi:hypothetical protein
MARYTPDDIWCESCHGSGCPKCSPPMPPRCAYCGEAWPKAGTVCGVKCAASLAADFAAYATGACSDEERAIADAAEATATRNAHRHDRDF